MLEGPGSLGHTASHPAPAGPQENPVSRLPTEPLAPIQILFHGMQLGASIFGKLFMGTTLIGFVMLLPTLDTAMRLGNDELTPERMLAILGWRWVLVQLSSAALVLLVQAFLITRIDSLAREGRMDARAEWQNSLRAWLPLFLAFLLCIGIVVVACVAGAVAGLVTGLLATLLAGKAGFASGFLVGVFAAVVFVAIYLLFIQYFVALERRGPVDSINLSFNLVHGHWWHTFQVLLALLFVMVSIGLLCSIPLAAVSDLGDSIETGRSLLERGVLEMVASAVFGPFLFSILYLQYLDLKLRKPSVA